MKRKHFAIGLIGLFIFCFSGMIMAEENETGSLQDAQQTVALYQCGSLESDAPDVMTLSLEYEDLKSKINSSLAALEEELDLSSDYVTIEEMRTAYTEVVNSHPELFYAAASYQYSFYAGSPDRIVKVKWNYRESDKNKIAVMKNDMEKRISAILSHIDSSMKPQEKLMVIHEALILNTKYSFTTEWENNSANGGCYTAYCVLVEGNGVCQGYSLAFHMLAERVGITDQFVASSEMNHAWNFVYLNGEGYHIDCTWDDQGGTNGRISHNNFLLSDAGIRKTGHSVWNDESITAVDTTYDDYYWRTSAYASVIVKGKDQWYCVKKIETGFSNLKEVWAEEENVTYYGSESEKIQVPLTECRLIDSTLIPNASGGGSAETTPIREIQLSNTFLQLYKGQSVGLRANRIPAESEGEITWRSSNPEVAEVSENGTIKALKKGCAVIFAESGTVSAQCEIKVEIRAMSVIYQTHVQSYGWQNWVSDGELSGTSGQAKRLEAIRIRIPESEDLGIRYQTQVQSYGWQNWVSDGELSGTSGQAKRLEAIRIQLTGSAAEDYDIYYRVHAQSYGWLGWAKNGDAAGTEGLAKRLEALQIIIVEKGSNAPGEVKNCFMTAPPHITYRTHVQTYGWQNWVSDGGMSGTSGQAKRLEAIQILCSAGTENGGIEYRTHVQTYGWQPWVKDGALSGTSGQGKRLEAIRIQLTGTLAEKYDVYYRVHAQSFGWLGWAKNGEAAGTEGYAKRLEGIEIKLVEKNKAVQGTSTPCFVVR